MYGCIIKSSILVFVVGSSAKKEDQKVDYLLRTQGWPTKSEEILRLENKTEIVKSSFDASKPTTFLIHGYTEDTKTPNHQRLSRFVVIGIEEIENQIISGHLSRLKTKISSSLTGDRGGNRLGTSKLLTGFRK